MRAYNIKVRAGNSGLINSKAGLQLILKTGSPPVDMDLSAAEVVFVVRRCVESPILLRKSLSDGGITAEGSTLIIPFTVEDTRSLWVTNYGASVSHFYEVELRESDGSQRTVLFGKIEVLAGVNDD